MSSRPALPPGVYRNSTSASARSDEGETDDPPTWLDARATIANALNAAVAPRHWGEARTRITAVASRHRNCGELFVFTGPHGPDFALRTCAAPLLCPWCSENRAWKLSQLDGARVAILAEQHPDWRFLFVTVKCAESSDLRQQACALKKRISRMLKRRTMGFVMASIRQMHPQRGVGGGWYAHVHMILVVKCDGGVRPTAWFQAKLDEQLCADEERGSLLKGETWHIESFFRTTRLERSALARLKMTPEFQASRISRYAAEVPEANVYDRIERFEGLFDIRLRSISGSLRGLGSDKALKAKWTELEVEAEFGPSYSHSPSGKEGGTPLPLDLVERSPLLRAARLRKAAWRRETLEHLLQQRTQKPAKKRPKKNDYQPVTGKVVLPDLASEGHVRGSIFRHLPGILEHRPTSSPPLIDRRSLNRRVQTTVTKRPIDRTRGDLISSPRNGGISPPPDNQPDSPRTSTSEEIQTMKPPSNKLPLKKKILRAPTPPPPSQAHAKSAAGSEEVATWHHGVALSGGDPNKAPTKAGLLSYLDLKQLQLSPDFNPRTNAGPIEELAAGIKAEGVLSSLVVRPSKTSGKFDIIAGERRFRACKAISYDLPIPCIIRLDLIGDDARALAVALAENSEEGRTNLNMIEIGRACHTLRGEGWTVQRISLECGFHTERVRRALALVETPAEVQKNVEAGLWSVRAALEYARLDEATRKAVKDKIAQAPTADDIRKLRKKAEREAAEKKAEREAAEKKASLSKGPMPVVLNSRGKPKKLRSVTAWRKAGERQLALEELCAKFIAIGSEGLGTDRWHQIRGGIACSLWIFGDLPHLRAPILQPVPGSPGYAKQVKDLAIFNAVIKAQAARYESSDVETD